MTESIMWGIQQKEDWQDSHSRRVQCTDGHYQNMKELPLREGVLEMAGRDTSSRARDDFHRTWIERDEDDVQNIMDTIQNIINPIDLTLE